MCDKYYVLLTNGEEFVVQACSLAEAISEFWKSELAEELTSQPPIAFQRRYSVHNGVKELAFQVDAAPALLNVPKEQWPLITAAIQHNDADGYDIFCDQTVAAIAHLEESTDAKN